MDGDITYMRSADRVSKIMNINVVIINLEMLKVQQQPHTHTVSTAIFEVNMDQLVAP